MYIMYIMCIMDGMYRRCTDVMYRMYMYTRCMVYIIYI